MDSKKILKVRVDASRGVCEIIDGEGKVVASKDARSYYNSVELKKRRDEFYAEKKGRIPQEKITFVDFLVYDILTEYDSEHQGAEYAKKYLATVTDQITYNIPSSDEPLKDKILRKLTGRTIETEATYLKRVREIKTENLSKAGLSISYDDAKDINASQALTISQRQVAVEIAKRQAKYNGIQTGELVEVPVVEESDIPELSAEELEAQRQAAKQEAEEAAARKAAEAEAAKKAAEEEAARKAAEEEAAQSGSETPKSEEHSDDDDEPKGPNGAAGGSSEEPITGEPKAEEGEAPQVETPEAEVPVGETPRKNQAVPKAKNKKRKIDGIRAGRKAYRERLQKGKTPKADRADGAEAPKRETKAERKERLAREALERKLNSSNPKPEAPIFESKNQKPEVKNASKPKAEKTPKTLGLKRLNVEELKVRFTRKLESIKDSIRNKVHKPTGKQLKITGVVALASLLLLAGIKGYEYFSNAEVRGVMADTTSVVQILEGEKEIGNDKIIIKSATEVADSSEDGSQAPASGGGATAKTETETLTRTETQTPDKAQAQGADASREYLSSIRLGSIMSIDNGTYFATPEGTGNHGNFENYKNYDKKLNAFGITIKEGYIQIEENGVYVSPSLKNYFNVDELEELKNMNLYELKQKFSDAKFSYHFGGEHKEDREKSENEKRKTTLGWLTENSFEQTIDTTRSQTQIEDLER